MFAWLRSWMSGSSRVRTLTLAQARRANTMYLLRQAESRGDCREIGRLRMVPAADTASELKASWG